MTAPPSTRVELRDGELVVLGLVRKRWNRSSWLIRRTGLHERTVMRYLLHLYQEGLVDRYRWETDNCGWEWHYTVTPAGRDALAAG